MFFFMSQNTLNDLEVEEIWTVVNIIKGKEGLACCSVTQGRGGSQAQWA